MASLTAKIKIENLEAYQEKTKELIALLKEGRQLIAELGDQSSSRGQGISLSRNRKGGGNTMHEVKTFEIRDRATYIPVFAFAIEPVWEVDEQLIRSMGFGLKERFVYLVWPDGNAAHYDPYQWGADPRTMHCAHKYIAKHYAKLESGAVIDVEYILGETDAPKAPQRLDGAYGQCRKGMS